MSLNTILATAPLTTSGYHIKANGTTLGNSLIWDNGTNVGIGNTNTSYTLDVSGTLRNTTSAYFATTSGNVGIGTTTATNKLTITNDGNAANALRINDTNANASFLSISASNTDAAIIANGTAAIPLDIYTGGSARVRVSATGNVGIGTSSPAAVLEVAGTSSTADFRISRTVSSSTYFYIKAPGGTPSTANMGVNGTDVMSITSAGNVGVGETNPSNARFYVTSDGSALDNMYIVNTNASAGTNNSVVFRRVANTVGTIQTTLTTTSYNTSSDYRLKQDFKNYNGLNLVLSIKTYDYEWKMDNTRMYGVLAHELSEVIPYAVSGEKDAVNEDGSLNTQGVDYSKLVPVLVKAIQEMNTKLDEQNQTIQSLQEQINILAK